MREVVAMPGQKAVELSRKWAVFKEGDKRESTAVYCKRAQPSLSGYSCIVRDCSAHKTKRTGPLPHEWSGADLMAGASRLLDRSQTTSGGFAGYVIDRWKRQNANDAFTIIEYRVGPQNKIPRNIVEVAVSITAEQRVTSESRPAIIIFGGWRRALHITNLVGQPPSMQWSLEAPFSVVPQKEHCMQCS